MPEGIGYDEPAYKGKMSNPHYTEKTQLVATGGVAERDVTNVEAEVRDMGIDLEGWKSVPNGGQGGN